MAPNIEAIAGITAEYRVAARMRFIGLRVGDVLALAADAEKLRVNGCAGLTLSYADAKFGATLNL